MMQMRRGFEISLVLARAKRVICFLLFSVFLLDESALAATPSVPLEVQIGQMVMVGFHGTSSKDEEVRQLHAQIEAGYVGGVILYGYNVKSREQMLVLIDYLRSAKTRQPLLIAVDQEGGKVQRFKAANGFTDYLSAKMVAKTLSVAEAEAYYRKLACELRDIGVNYNFAPVVDVDINPESPVIGGLERSFSADAVKVGDYAEALIKAHKECGVLTSLKHFPGHGSATGDTHKGFVDVTATYDKREREPYKQLIAQGMAESVMAAHVVDKNVDTLPASLSSAHIGNLRQLGFDGVVISDDMQMGAVSKLYDFNQSVVTMINAGENILIVSNYFDPAPDWPIRIRGIVLEAVKNRLVDPKSIEASYRRIVDLKSLLR